LLLIDGEWLEEGGGGTIRVQDPATEEYFADVPRSLLAEVDRACKAARRAFSTWSRTTPLERAVFLSEAATALEGKADEIAELLTREQGKPLKEAKGEVKAAAQALRSFSRHADLPVEEAHHRSGLRGSGPWPHGG